MFSWEFCLPPAEYWISHPPTRLWIQRFNPHITRWVYSSIVLDSDIEEDSVARVW